MSTSPPIGQGVVCPKAATPFWEEKIDLSQALEFGHTLETFWERFQQTDPSFPFFTDFPAREAWRSAIPLAIHGDEGRGRLKRPVMVVSTQTIIPVKEFRSNMQGYPS